MNLFAFGTLATAFADASKLPSVLVVDFTLGGCSGFAGLLGGGRDLPRRHLEGGGMDRTSVVRRTSREGCSSSSCQYQPKRQDPGPTAPSGGLAGGANGTGTSDLEGGGYGGSTGRAVDARSPASAPLINSPASSRPRKAPG